VTTALSRRDVILCLELALATRHPRSQPQGNQALQEQRLAQMALVEATSDSLASEQLMVPAALCMDIAAALMPIVRRIEVASLPMAFASRLEAACTRTHEWRAKRLMFSVWP
jgi:hypothetical protein